jgi:DNA primase
MMKLDHVTFQEAVERLAARLGYQLTYEEGGGPAQDAGQRARLLAANQAAADFFVAQLRTPEAEPARRFLGERGFDPAAAAHFGVGFAPRGGALAKHLRTVGVAQADAVTAGLLGTGERGDVYDRFRGRLVWPIRDTTGQTIGFGARRLLDDDKGPKYLNTPETPVYKKSQVLYGLDLARRDIAKGKQVVVVEGYTDVMACHLAGVTTAVATCGTAFGVDHIRIVRRVMGDSDGGAVGAAGEVVFTFDPDEAGQKAASRAFAEERQFAAQTFVAVAPDGLDPCDLRLQRGDDAVRTLVEHRRPLFEFMIRRTFAEFDLESAEGRVAALRAAAPVVAGIRDSALAVEYSRLLARWLGADTNDVLRAVRSAGARAARSDSAPKVQVGGEGRGAAVEADAAAHNAIGIASLPPDPGTRLERDVLMSVIQHPAAVGSELAARAMSATFSDPTLAVVRDAVAVHLGASGTSGWVERVVEEVPEPYRPLVQQLAVAPVPGREDAIDATVRGFAVAIIERDLLREKRELLGALQRLDPVADAERSTQVQQQLKAVEETRRALKGE